MFARRGLRATVRAGLVAERSNSTIAGTIEYRIHYHDTAKTALLCPQEGIKWSYADLWGNVQKVAGGLTKLGYGPGSVIVSDLDNSVSNLVLQFAVAHSGMQILTVKSKAELDRLAPELAVQGAVTANAAGILGSASFPIKTLDAAAILGLDGAPPQGATDRAAVHAYYGSERPTENREIYLHGVGTAGLLEMQPGDQVCVAASLNSAFGFGGVLSSILHNATVYLPDMAKLDLADSTIIVTEQEHLQTLAKSGSKIRDGLVRVGNGTDVLGAKLNPAKVDFAGTPLFTLGHSPDNFRPLFDSCVDKYYSFK